MNEPLHKLRDIEESIALTDRQRLLVLRTTELAVATVLRESWEELKQGRAVTEMIARRMFNHYRSQQQLKSQIGLQTMTSASAIFQQSVGTYLRSYLEGIGDFEVRLEHRYAQGLQPDIAVECRGSAIAAVEVKTDLGWNRIHLRAGLGGQKAAVLCSRVPASVPRHSEQHQLVGLRPRDAGGGGSGAAGDES